MNQPQLPDGLEHVRTTDVFDNTTVPAGLLRAHRVADGVWGRVRPTARPWSPPSPASSPGSCGPK